MRVGKFLRPPGPEAHVEEEDSSEEDEDFEEEGDNDDEKADEEDEDDNGEGEDDDKDEGHSVSKKRKTLASGKKMNPRNKKQMKSKKKAHTSFFDEEAEDAGESEDEEEEDEVYGAHHDPHDRVKKHYTEEDIRREQLDEEAREMMRQQDRRRQMMMGGRDITQLSAADMVRDIEERHRMLRRTMDRHVIEAEESAVEKGHPLDVAVSQQSLVPSVSDPSLWMFSCAPGKEQELVIQIMNKCKAYAAQGKPLGITSAVAAQTKGKIYVESYSEPNVIVAVQGIRNLMQYSMRLVPINDMTTVMTVLPKKRPGMIHSFSSVFASILHFFLTE